MKKILLFVIVIMIFAACKTNDPNIQSEKFTGNIVGLIGCYDEKDVRTPDGYRKAVVIETNKGDSLLSFTMDIEAFDLSFRYGTYSISPIAIPYEFDYQEIDPKDKKYVHIAPIVEDAAHQPCNIPSRQVDVMSL